MGKILWRREWQPTPVFLPGEFHGQRSLKGYSPWGDKESNMTEWLTFIQRARVPYKKCSINGSYHLLGRFYIGLPLSFPWSIYSHWHIHLDCLSLKDSFIVHRHFQEVVFTISLKWGPEFSYFLVCLLLLTSLLKLWHISNELLHLKIVRSKLKCVLQGEGYFRCILGMDF